MLRELLALLSEGNTLSQHELAERLGTTPEAMAARLDFLHRAGYLRKVCAVDAVDAAAGCGKKCAACPLGNAAPRNAPVIWEAVK
jgi:predicted ArsR family transcriptional regulator